MAVLKCKMCGGNLPMEEGMTFVECEFCGTTQTIPCGNDTKKTNLFNRANRLRIANEFDMAAIVYESILAEFPEEAEAYWGLCLCKFGIEYVDDSKTAEKIPTCHRTSFESIFNDNNYKMAISHSDPVAQGIYRDEAKAIDTLQKNILSIVNKEKPFDVFICYKETDDNGSRTIDSVLAQDIYDHLTEKGFKVFFSRITLEDKLGQEYEPYIFAALNSAKVMLVVGTTYENFDAVWVKNEWSRYMSLMKEDHSKTLIPCYKDIDPYDMPDEFSHLQAQDMSKIGFMQDLARGIQKLIVITDTPQKHDNESKASVVLNNNTSSLLKRAFMFLEDGEFENASEYCDRVLDLDAECAKAYTGLFMAENHIKKEEQIADIDNGEIAKDKNFSKALRFADDDYRSVLICYADTITKKIRAEKAQKKKKQMELQPIREKLSKARSLIAVGLDCIFGIKSDETVIAVDSSDQYEVADWQNIIAVAAGNLTAFGLKSNGTVVAIGYNENGQCEVSSWQNIVAIVAGNSHTVGLKSNGTVAAIGYNEHKQCEVSSWRDIAAIAAGNFHTVGLRSDRTVTAVGSNDNNQCEVSEWQDIVAIAAGNSHTVGLKSDGTVTAIGNNIYGQCEVSKWQDIVSIAAGEFTTFGLKSDGTVVAVGKNDDGECNVLEWQDVIAVAAGKSYTVGLRSDGTLISVGNNSCENISNIKLFNHFDTLKEDREEYQKATERHHKTEEQQRKIKEQRRSEGVCQYCGSAFKGLFKKTCSVCGKEKDY